MTRTRNTAQDLARMAYIVRTAYIGGHLGATAAQGAIAELRRLEGASRWGAHPGSWVELGVNDAERDWREHWEVVSIPALDA